MKRINEAEKRRLPDGCPLLRLLLTPKTNQRPLTSSLNREGSAVDEDAAPVKIYGYVVRL